MDDLRITRPFVFRTGFRELAKRFMRLAVVYTAWSAAGLFGTLIFYLIELREEFSTGAAISIATGAILALTACFALLLGAIQWSPGLMTLSTAVLMPIESTVLCAVLLRSSKPSGLIWTGIAIAAFLGVFVAHRWQSRLESSAGWVSRARYTDEHEPEKTRDKRAQ